MSSHERKPFAAKLKGYRAGLAVERARAEAAARGRERLMLWLRRARRGRNKG